MLPEFHIKPIIIFRFIAECFYEEERKLKKIKTVAIDQQTFQELTSILMQLEVYKPILPEFDAVYKAGQKIDAFLQGE